jgi:hypothetical protein
VSRAGISAGRVVFLTDLSLLGIPIVLAAMLLCVYVVFFVLHGISPLL